MINKKFNFGKKLLIFAILILFIPLFGTICSADDQELAEQYAPILYFEKDEECYPVDVSYHIDNSVLRALGDQYSDISYKASDIDFDQLSTIATQIGISEDDLQYAYLDNSQGTIEDDGIINHYKNSMYASNYKVYAHVETGDTQTVIQYWMFYAFNDGDLNRHEGDWEMVQITILGDYPSKVAYSQHESGQTAAWNQVEKDSDNMKVYVARGSHANYLRYYSGKVGLASDDVGKNGKILQPSDYDIELLESQGWLDFPGRWGEISDPEDLFLGKAGPFGPQYRHSGSMWSGVGAGYVAANDNLFLLEWVVYHFVMLFLIFAAIFLAVTAFRIFRRYKKFGLGPRIVSMLYIDGPNLKTIGNILCIVGLIIAIFALFNPWYNISYSISGDAAGYLSFQTEGMQDLISVDGINGVQIVIPGTTGPKPMGTLDLPFSFFIGIGIIFLVLATIGIHKSKKLGKKYIFKGIRFLIPIILILVVMFLIGSLISSMVGNMIPSGGGSSTIQGAAMSALNELKSSPYGGQSTIPISQDGVTGSVGLQWGLGSGMQFLLIAGIVVIVAGVFEIVAKTEFFKVKAYEKPKKSKKKKKEKPKKEEKQDKKDVKDIPESEEPKEVKDAPKPKESPDDIRKEIDEGKL